MMIKYFIGLIILIQCSLSFSHLCVFDPPQREPTFAVPILPGDNACYRINGNCGNISSGAPVAQYQAGTIIQVHFQQNYNHWYGPNPGFLDVSISYDGDNGNFQQISQTIDDLNTWDMVSQTNYTVSVALPSQSCKNCVLRVRYVSNNKGEPYPDFYQCSDISIQ